MADSDSPFGGLVQPYDAPISSGYVAPSGAVPAPLPSGAGSLLFDPRNAAATRATALTNGQWTPEGPSTADDVWSRMREQESGGKQFGASGNPLTSPKGAIGVAQVMPGTAPEAAKLAGLPWDEQRYKTDAGYNSALGRAYYEKQLSDFGDPAKAAAAYNAGPGAVQSAIAKGGDDWLSHLPRETQDYVNGAVGMAGASGSSLSPQVASSGQSMASTATAASQPPHPGGLYALAMLQSMFPQHAFTRIDYDPWKAMPTNIKPGPSI